MKAEIGAQVLFNSNADDDLVGRTGEITQYVRTINSYVYFIYLDDEDDQAPVSAQRDEFEVLS